MANKVNGIAYDLRTPKYKKRVVQSKKTYDRRKLSKPSAVGDIRKYRRA